MMPKFVILTTGMLLLLVGFCPKFSQAQKSKNQVSGTVMDSTDKKPLAYVTVGLFKKDKLAQVLKTSYTDSKGKFRFSAVDSGSHTLVFTHAGFGEYKKNVNVAGNTDIGEMVIGRVSVTLKDVKILVQKPLVEQTDDKITFNVENDPDSKSSTTLDIFRKTPFLSVDGDDNVQMNGQGNFKILLNGRETSMFARNLKEALRSFPGTLISKIEVITNPPAKYDAEGVGGVINIITKKKVTGYNGSLSTFNRTGLKANNVGLNFNIKTGKVGVALFYFFNFYNDLESKNYVGTVPRTPSYFSKREVNEKWLNDNFFNAGNMEFSYEIDSLNTVSAYGNLNGGSGKNEMDREIRTDYSSSPSTTSFQDLVSNYSNPGYNVGTDYIRKFKKNKEKEFSVRFYGEFSRNTQSDDSWQDNPGTDRYLLNDSKNKNNQYTIQSDYILPLKNSTKLESGAKMIIRRASSDFQSYVKYDPLLDYELDPSNSDFFKYRQDVYSAYSSYNFKTKKTNFRVGARIEFTRVDGDFITSGTRVNQRYANVIPNLQSTTKLNPVLTLILSYTDRLQRPFIWNLNPFVNNTDSVDISYGNPKLGPQIMHVAGAQLRYQKGQTFGNLGTQVFFTNTYIIEFSSFDPTTGVTSRTSSNLGKGYQINLNGNLNGTLNPKWNYFINGSFQYNKTKNKSKAGQFSEGIGGNLNMGYTWKFAKKISVSNFFGLNKAPALIQAKYSLNPWYNVVFNFKLLKEKVNMSLRAVNFFTREWDYKTVLTDDYFQTTRINTRLIRGFVITMNWNFGKLKENVSKKKGVTNDDLLNKTDGGGTNN